MISPRHLLLCASMFTAVSGAALASAPAARPMITGAVDDAATMALPHDVPGALAASRDQGRIDDAVALPHIRLTLKRSPEAQEALDTLTRNQHVRGAAEFHQWLKPAALRAYGPAHSPQRHRRPCRRLSRPKPTKPISGATAAPWPQS